VYYGRAVGLGRFGREASLVDLGRLHDDRHQLALHRRAGRDI